ncbi:MAG TPA: phage baseplate assembly protein V [Candidatus Polarisedimenticolia bacterium]|jgi:phage baseplate assembly protein gpV|nr:phage baseplate assembly protein V [Candidatus Polarisedimenticolia bacterium]
MMHGIQCRLEVLSSGRTLRPHGEIVLTEDIDRGSRLFAQLEETPAAPGIGEPLHIRVQQTDPGGEQVLEAALWTSEVSRLDDGRMRTLFVEAIDPLGFSNLQRQFVSRAGRIPLLRLADQVLAAQPGALADLRPSSQDSPQVPEDWLLQCDETGREFLNRIARSLGHLVYWARGELRCDVIGRTPAQDGPPARLQFGRDLLSLMTRETPDLDSQRIFWTDPVTRHVSAANFEGQVVNGRTPANGLARRVSSCSRPEAPSCVGEVGTDEFGVRLLIETTRPDLALGAQIQVEGGPACLVTAIEHHLHAQGSYRNRLVCVPDNRWGIGGAPAIRGLKGPFQGEVTHNDDPLGQQRVRIILSEDPERRPTPWLPLTTVSAGEGRGLYWLPEVGDIVLVTANAECPESLVCIGSLRGKHQKAETSWRSGKNAVKVLGLRNGVRIVFDDEKKTIRLETGGAYLELRGDGKFHLSGRELDVAMAANIRLDAARIDLGS